MKLQFPDSVTVVEMLPRDGFQRYEDWVPTDEKVRIVDRLSRTGISEIEVTSFTHPKVVPNLRDAEDVFANIDRQDDVVYRALVPNVVGMQRALDADVDKVNALVTVSPEYNRRNQNMTIEENLEVIGDIVDLAEGTDVIVEAGIGMSFFSPYEGETAAEDTLGVVEAVIEKGVDEVTLATSMGMANPKQIASLVSSVYDRWSSVDLGLHLHDTNGMSLANTLVAMQLGVTRFDASVCGLGGGVILPEEMEYVGNTPTEDLVNMLREMDIESDIDFVELESVARDAMESLGIPPNSHVLKGGTRARILEQSD